MMTHQNVVCLYKHGERQRERMGRFEIHFGGIDELALWIGLRNMCGEHGVKIIENEFQTSSLRNYEKRYCCSLKRVDLEANV